MLDISEIKLIRTDTTLDLSQKAEKVCQRDRGHGPPEGCWWGVAAETCTDRRRRGRGGRERRAGSGTGRGRARNDPNGFASPKRGKGAEGKVPNPDTRGKVVMRETKDREGKAPKEPADAGAWRREADRPRPVEARATVAPKRVGGDRRPRNGGRTVLEDRKKMVGRRASASLHRYQKFCCVLTPIGSQHYSAAARSASRSSRIVGLPA